MKQPKVNRPVTGPLSNERICQFKNNMKQSLRYRGRQKFRAAWKRLVDSVVFGTFRRLLSRSRAWRLSFYSREFSSRYQQWTPSRLSRFRLRNLRLPNIDLPLSIRSLMSRKTLSSWHLCDMHYCVREQKIPFHQNIKEVLILRSVHTSIQDPNRCTRIGMINHESIGCLPDERQYP